MARDTQSTAAETSQAATRQEWSRPVLRKLPIAATSSGGKGAIIGDDGNCGGKGDAAACLS